jgi:hypothetical protein
MAATACIPPGVVELIPHMWHGQAVDHLGPRVNHFTDALVTEGSEGHNFKSAGDWCGRIDNG